MPPNRIIELGAYRIKKGRIVDEFVTLVNPELPIPRFVMTLTRISNEWSGAPVLRRGGASVAGICRRRGTGGHNAPFDTNFLNHGSREFTRHRMVNFTFAP